MTRLIKNIVKNFHQIFLKNNQITNFKTLCGFSVLTLYLSHIKARPIILTYLFRALAIKNSFNIAYRGRDKRVPRATCGPRAGGCTGLL